jgi:hypothetical protein
MWPPLWCCQRRESWDYIATFREVMQWRHRKKAGRKASAAARSWETSNGGLGVGLGWTDTQLREILWEPLTPTEH